MVGTISDSTVSLNRSYKSRPNMYGHLIEPLQDSRFSILRTRLMSVLWWSISRSWW